MFESCPKCATPVVSVATTNTNYVVETPTPDKKLTPIAAHIEWLKKERKTLYEFGYDVAADRISKAIDNATSLLEAEREMVVNARTTSPILLFTSDISYAEESAGYFTQNYRQQ